MKFLLVLFSETIMFLTVRIYVLTFEIINKSKNISCIK